MNFKRVVVYLLVFIASIHGYELSVYADEKFGNFNSNTVENTGELQPMTEEEIRLKEETSVLSEDAYLNELALERINEQLKEDGMPEVYFVPAEFGEETLTTDTEIAPFSIIRAPQSNLLIKSNNHLEQPSKKKTQSIIPFPKKVDNSTDERTANCFPPAGQQGFFGSCGAFASTYYQMTYMNALVKGYDVKNDTSKILSPKFTYNIGRKSDTYRIGGLWPSTAYAIVQKHGCPFNVDYPYLDFDTMDGIVESDYLGWPTESDIWEKALENKVKTSGWGYIGDKDDTAPVENVNDKNLELIKTYLANGYVLNIVTYEGSWKRKNIPGGGKICISVNGNKDLHAMTVVGYDDTIYYDIDEDGVEDEGEFGAFKIINSWGDDYNYEMWFAYDALNEISSVTGEQRTKGWVDNEFTWVTMYENYTPKLLAVFDITTNNRGSVDLSLGYGDVSSAETDKQWKPYIFEETKYSEQGLGNNNFNINGGTEEETASIVLDYTDLINENEIDKIDEAFNWYLLSNANISNFTIKDVPFDLVYESEDDLPNDEGTISCLCQLPLRVCRDKIWNISTNYPLNKESVKSTTVYVNNKNGEVFYTRAVLEDDTNITVTPITKYNAGSYYTLVIDGIKTLAGNGMKAPIKKHYLADLE